MNKIRLDGRDYVSVKDMRRAIRDCARIVKETYRNFDSEKQAMVYLAYGDIKRKLYEDELKSARTLDEIRAILEMPGDYVVVNYCKDCTWCQNTVHGKVFCSREGAMDWIEPDSYCSYWKDETVKQLKRMFNETDIPDRYPGIFDAIEEWLSELKLPLQPERKKGEWIDIGGVIRYGCPFCHYAQERKSNFCPNCGADLRGE